MSLPTKFFGTSCAKRLRCGTLTRFRYIGTLTRFRYIGTLTRFRYRGRFA